LSEVGPAIESVNPSASVTSAEPLNDVLAALVALTDTTAGEGSICDAE
jgi:hypothetical protein